MLVLIPGSRCVTSLLSRRDHCLHVFFLSFFLPFIISLWPLSPPLSHIQGCVHRRLCWYFHTCVHRRVLLFRYSYLLLCLLVSFLCSPVLDFSMTAPRLVRCPLLSKDELARRNKLLGLPQVSTLSNLLPSFMH